MTDRSAAPSLPAILRHRLRDRPLTSRLVLGVLGSTLLSFALAAVAVLEIGRLRAVGEEFAESLRGDPSLAASVRAAMLDADFPVLLALGALAFAALLCAGWTLRTIRRDLIAPITKLLAAVGDLDGTAREQRIDLPQIGEIGLLAESLNRMVERLHESNQRLMTILNSAAIGILNIDEDGRIESFNATAERIFGISEKEVLGRDFQTLLAGGDPVDTSAPTEPWSGSCEILGRRRSGETFPISMSINPARLDGRLTFTVIVRDISERRLAQTEKQQLEAQLRHAQKLELVGTLAGGIAHDFANILTPMLAYTEMVYEELPTTAVEHTYLDRVLKGGERAKNLVEQILTFSGQVEETRAPLQIRPILKEALRLIRALLPATIRIEERISSESDVVLADAGQIHQVIMNLCTNAFHAMREEGGVLTVELGTVDIDADTALAEARLRPASYVRLLVRDSGAGMDAATCERIFEPFFTTKRRGEGTGLGLSVVHGIVRSHDGEIRVTSHSGAGTAFEVFFPIADQPICSAALPSQGDPAGHERILFLDDEEEIALVAKRILERLGYEVFVRTTSQDAIDVFRRFPDKIDVVITDQTMPEITGAQLCRRLREIRPDVPVILVSGLGEGLTEDTVRGVGIGAFVRKPFTARDLGLAIRKVLENP